MKWPPGNSCKRKPNEHCETDENDPCHMTHESYPDNHEQVKDVHRFGPSWTRPARRKRFRAAQFGQPLRVNLVSVQPLTYRISVGSVGQRQTSRLRPCGPLKPRYRVTQKPIARLSNETGVFIGGSDDSFRDESFKESSSNVCYLDQVENATLLSIESYAHLGVIDLQSQNSLNTLHVPHQVIMPNKHVRKKIFLWASTTWPLSKSRPSSPRHFLRFCALSCIGLYSDCIQVSLSHDQTLSPSVETKELNLAESNEIGLLSCVTQQRRCRLRADNLDVIDQLQSDICWKILASMSSSETGMPEQRCILSPIMIASDTVSCSTPHCVKTATWIASAHESISTSWLSTVYQSIPFEFPRISHLELSLHRIPLFNMTTSSLDFRPIQICQTHPNVTFQLLDSPLSEVTQLNQSLSSSQTNSSELSASRCQSSLSSSSGVTSLNTDDVTSSVLISCAWTTDHGLDHKTSLPVTGSTLSLCNSGSEYEPIDCVHSNETDAWSSDCDDEIEFDEGIARQDEAGDMRMTELSTRSAPSRLQAVTSLFVMLG